MTSKVKFKKNVALKALVMVKQGSIWMTHISKSYNSFIIHQRFLFSLLSANPMLGELQASLKITKVTDVNMDDRANSSIVLA